MRESREQRIINILSTQLRLHEQIFPLDDVALIDLGKTKRPRLLAFKCDMLVGSTDVPPSMKSWQVARKSIVSCVSDFAAKGIAPSTCLLSLGLPQSISLRTIKELSHGFGRASKDFGQTAAGLKIILDNAMANKQVKSIYLSSVMLPKPRLKFGVSLRKFLSSSIDSSDGLAYSLYRLAIKSNVDFHVERIPTASGIDEFASQNAIPSKDLVLYGGEEFEIIGTIPLKRLSRARQVAISNGLKLIEIGKVTKGSGKVFLTRKGNISEELENRGYSDL